MKYIRTEDGIYEVENDIENTYIFGYVKNEKNHLLQAYKDVYEEYGEETNWTDLGEIIKIADTIEELIMPGDLVRYDVLYMSWIEKDRGDKVRGIDMHLIPRKSVDMLWIPIGIDTECYPNFKLVASKEDKEGVLELL